MYIEPSLLRSRNIVYAEILILKWEFPYSGDSSIRFADYSLIPRNEDFLRGNSENCTVFQQKDANSNDGFTQFRITARVAEFSEINVTIKGTRFGCGKQLFVSPLTLSESETWLGRWKSFKLAEITENNKTETCLYRLRFTSPINEIQVLRTSFCSEYLNWGICLIKLSIKSAGM